MPSNDIFRAYDIRGVYGKELFPEDSLKVGLGFGAYLKNFDAVIVGRDVRLSSPLMAMGAIAGLLASGKNVIDVGVASTPQICFSALKAGVPALAVGASHNPPEYNGFKFERPDGCGFAGRRLEGIYGSIKTGFQKRKKIGKYSAEDTSKKYAENVVEKTEPARSLKIVVDVSNGCGGIAIDILRKLGHKVTGINERQDGRFPAHLPEPLPETMVQLSRKVRALKADFGVAFDGDADRAAFVDDAGRQLRTDSALLVMVEKALSKRKGTILATVNCSQKVEEVARSLGGKMRWCRVGRVFVDSVVKTDRKIVLGGEESGHFWFPDFYAFSEGPLAAAKMAEALGGVRRLSEVMDGFGPSTIVKGVVKCPESKKTRAMEKLLRLLEGEGEIKTIDGIKLVTEKYWLLVRPSNTEPILKLNVEAPTIEEANELMKKYRRITEECVRKTG